MFQWIIESIIPAPHLEAHQNIGLNPPSNDPQINNMAELNQPKVQLAKKKPSELLEEPLDFQTLSKHVTRQDNLNLKGNKKSIHKKNRKNNNYDANDSDDADNEKDQ